MDILKRQIKTAYVLGLTILLALIPSWNSICSAQSVVQITISRENEQLKLYVNGEEESKDNFKVCGPTDEALYEPITTTETPASDLAPSAGTPAATDETPEGEEPISSPEAGGPSTSPGGGPSETTSDSGESSGGSGSSPESPDEPQPDTSQPAQPPTEGPAPTKPETLSLINNLIGNPNIEEMMNNMSPMQLGSIMLYSQNPTPEDEEFICPGGAPVDVVNQTQILLELVTGSEGGAGASFLLLNPEQWNELLSTGFDEHTALLLPDGTMAAIYRFGDKIRIFAGTPGNMEEVTGAAQLSGVENGNFSAAVKGYKIEGNLNHPGSAKLV